MIASARKFFYLLLLLPVMSLAQVGESRQDQDIERYLSAVQFSASFKHGILTEVKRQGRSNDEIDRILALSDNQLISAVTPIFREHVSPQEAKEIADFYASNTGLAITRQQVANIGNPDPPIRLTAAQHAAYRKFEHSAGGRAISRLAALQQTETYWQQVGQAISAAAKE